MRFAGGRKKTMSRATPLVVWFGLGIAVTACAGDEKRPLGETCGSSSECESGLCLAGVCLDPDADDDRDGLTNRIEAALGSNALNADSDYDGARDGDEVSVAVDNVDTDGDSKPDVLESATLDADSDCVPDQFDGDDVNVATDLSALSALVCNPVGVCGTGVALVTVSCPAATHVALCDYGAIPGYEADETTCDGKDNDCDGRSDEGSGDADGDGTADCVDDDRDNDSVSSAADNCPDVANAGQEDADGDLLGDACDLPGPVVITGFDPPSPTPSTTPKVEGTGEALVSLAFFADAKCTVALGQGQVDVAGRFSVGLTVPPDAATPIYLRATNRAGLASECRPSAAVLVNDATLPAPIALATPVTSPTQSDLAELDLAAPSEAVTVDLYQRTSLFNPLALESDCAGTPWRTVRLDAGQAAMLVVALAPNRKNEVFARTRDLAGNASACTTLATIVHDDEMPPVPLLAGTTVETLSAPHGGDPEFEVEGCAEADATVELFANETCGGAALARVDSESDVAECESIAGSGGWSARLEVTANAATRFWMQVVDQAGNRSACFELGNYVHDSIAPAAASASAIRGTSWGVGVATFAVEGSGEVGADVMLAGSATCWEDLFGPATVAADGRWHGDITAFAATPVLYGMQVDRAGNPGPCVELGTLFGPVTFTLSSRGKPRVEDTVVINAPDGTPLASVATDAAGIAEATIVAGCSATAVTRFTTFSYSEWTSVLGLEPGQAVSLEVDDGSTDNDPGTPAFYVQVTLPAAPAQTDHYRVMTACGADEIYFEGSPARSFETWFDTGCSSEGDLTLIVEALAADGEQLGFLNAMHVAFPAGEQNARVNFSAPWRTDYAVFAVTVDPGTSPSPFQISHRFGHKSEVFQDFWSASRSGFAAPGRPVTVAAKFPNIEYGDLGWSIAAAHLGASGDGRRSYTELGAYLPGSDSVSIEDDLLPRVWMSEVAIAESGAWVVNWSHEPGLAAASDAFFADLYLSGAASSLSWRIIGRPSQDLGFALPMVKELAGADALGPDSYVDLSGVEWIDWATVAGFGAWVDACTGVDLNTCARGLAETVTRTSSMRRGGGER